MRTGTDGVWMKQNISSKLNVYSLILNAATSKYQYKFAVGWTGISRPTNVNSLITYKAGWLLTNSIKFDTICPCTGMQHSVSIKWFYDGNIWKTEARFSGTTLWAVIPCCLRTMSHIKWAAVCYRSPLTTIRPKWFSTPTSITIHIYLSGSCPAGTAERWACHSPSSVQTTVGIVHPYHRKPF